MTQSTQGLRATGVIETATDVDVFSFSMSSSGSVSVSALPFASTSFNGGNNLDIAMSLTDVNNAVLALSSPNGQSVPLYFAALFGSGRARDFFFTLLISCASVSVCHRVCLLCRLSPSRSLPLCCCSEALSLIFLGQLSPHLQPQIAALPLLA